MDFDYSFFTLFFFSRFLSRRIRGVAGGDFNFSLYFFNLLLGVSGFSDA